MEKLHEFQTLVDIPKEPEWYAALNILIIGIWGDTHMDNITNLLEQWYISLMPFHACMQQIHLTSITYLNITARIIAIPKNLI